MKIFKDQPLSEFTSLRVGGNAHRLIILENGDSLLDAIQQIENNQPVWVLGYGTNVLVSDGGLAGTVMLNHGGSIDQQDARRFKVSSGVIWDDFVRKVIGEKLWGIEFTSGIPGGVGGAVAGNIAAYGQKVSDTFIEATLYNLQNDAKEIWTKEDFDFNYRSSSMQKPENQKYVILDATFEFSDGPTNTLEYASALEVSAELKIEPDTLENRRQIIMETRRRAGSLLSNNSVSSQTAGSFFKNPIVSPDQAQTLIKYEEKATTASQVRLQNIIHGGSSSRVSAAHILLAAGFRRGQAWGSVRLHPEHILKIENTGNATAREIYDVVQLIMTTVREKLDIILEPEVQFLGNF